MEDEDKFNSRKLFLMKFGSPELIDEHVDKWHPTTKREREFYHTSQVARSVINNPFAKDRQLDHVISKIPGISGDVDIALGNKVMNSLTKREDLPRKTRAMLFNTRDKHFMGNLVRSDQTTSDELKEFIENPVLHNIYRVAHNDMVQHPNFTKEHHESMLNRELEEMGKDHDRETGALASLINESPHLTKENVDRIHDAIVKSPSAMSPMSSHTRSIRALLRHPDTTYHQKMKMFYHAKDPDLTHDMIFNSPESIPKEALDHHAHHNLSNAVRARAERVLGERGIRVDIPDREDVVPKDLEIPKEYQ